MPPLISIVIAVFNGAKTLQQCIASIESQTYSHKELIIMDGGSTDGTVEILERNDVAIDYWESQKDRGIAHAWNKALEHASGDWIIFLGSDDRLHDVEVLSDVANIIAESKTVDLVYGRIIFEGGAYDGLEFGSQNDLEVIKRRMAVPHTATFHRRKLFTEIGKFDEQFQIAIDYEFFLRKKLTAHFMDRIVCVMGGVGMSSCLVKKSLSENRRAQIKNRADWRVKIELLYALFLLRHQLLHWRTKVRIHDSN
ncbi:glycosyltransferase family 2 protein [Sinimarinibacterium sp. CAU 1509]|uniref:glycosyltransferase family 2 protein n=1 Tax=Sinimarinibacterium sp. CAU 1509 TaxID=2562283 RepID=UPI001469CCC4|nr:glycosyltransferase family 2 protein [Sinimarinibacterium sp. CAU 1509]